MANVAEMKPGWEPSFDATLTTAYYDVMDKVGPRWNEFARCALKLEDNNIEDITQEEAKVREQKYKMCKKWEEKQGRRASIEYLYQILNHFLFPGDYPEEPQPLQNHHESEMEVTSQYCLRVSDVVINVKRAERREDFLPNYSKRYGKGKVLVINNSFKEGNYIRVGSEIDVENMKNIWESLGNDVTVQLDMTAEGMTTTIQEFAQSCTEHDYSVVVIMSHGGDNDVIIGSDQTELPAREVIEFFSRENTPNLAGKPKLFFFQTDRGQKIDRNHNDQEYHSRRHTRTGSEWRRETLITEKLDDQYRACSLPNFADMLICFATTPGYTSFRNRRNGSWFINAITNVFKKHAKQEHVLDLMVKVNEAVSSRIAYGCMFCHGENPMQMPQFECSIRKRLYLL